MSEKVGAVGEGVPIVSTNGVVLDAWFLKLGLTDVTSSGAVSGPTDSTDSVRYACADDNPTADDIRTVDIFTTRIGIASLQDAPIGVPDPYLRLQLLCHRLVRPNIINLDGLFRLSPTVA